MATEQEFEKALIEKLCTGQIGNLGDHIYKSKRWEYREDIKTTEALWNNFAEILYRNNQDTLEHPLSFTEFAQVKREIENLTTPYKAGQFLYGYNGVSQVEVDLDDGRHVFLTVFDQDYIGAGNTVYQVVNQIERPAKIVGKKDRRFDVTLLINGLPVIQIELKSETGEVDHALNQMHQYIEENQYSDIYSTLQVLVAMTPYDNKYMANTTPTRFNKDFAFHWQKRKDNSRVIKWEEFADYFLSIPAAHRMATTYMILDGTRNAECLKVMRPYQVYATEAVLEAIKARNPGDMGVERLGYIWHTTGSGKTITSFKTAWLASRLPGVDKVVFLVDRKQLTHHTFETYSAYDPEASSEDMGRITDTKNTGVLTSKLKSKRNDIIVTSVQKLERMVKRKNYKAPDRNYIFIVDEAHRSTGTGKFEELQKLFPHSGWVGYTGTPTFDDEAGHRATKHMFGNCLHSYTIRDAIKDKNVLGFKVDFQDLVPSKDFYEKQLPGIYRKKNPGWTDQQIADKIANMTDDEIADELSSSSTGIDNNPKYVEAVVQDIYRNWKNRSNDGKYNALLTTHVGGQQSSINMAMMYFDEFCRVNEEHKKNDDLVLKVGITFSEDDSNSDSMVDTNKSLARAIEVYNKEFHTSYAMDSVDSYREDLISRLDKSADDKNYLDLVIVVDQLLTGFDAPGLNTLYVDRVIRGANLIQAYSRTNRVQNMQDKPWGQVVNYRWPKLSERLMNEALTEYSNRENADKPEKDFENKDLDDILEKPFKVLLKETKEQAQRLREMTQSFNIIPPDTRDQAAMFSLLKQFNANLSKLKQYPYKANEDGTIEGYDYNHPEQLIHDLGMTEDEDKILSTTLTNELKHAIAKKEKIAPSDVDLTVVHLKDVFVDYGYLTELIGKLMNEVHDDDMEAAEETRKEINKYAIGLENPDFAKAVKQAADAIFHKMYPTKESRMEYPYHGFNVKIVVEEAKNVSIDKQILDFRNKWGITDAITTKELLQLVDNHEYGEQDLDDSGQMGDVIYQGSLKYTELAEDPEVRELRRLKYRNALRSAVYELADKLSQE